MRINELIVVEGKDDISAVKNAVEGEVIATGGYGFGIDLIKLLQRAVTRTGVIIFVDPDSAGNHIRRRLNSQIPACKNAYLTQQEAKKGCNIGIENASSEAIRRALQIAASNCAAIQSDFTLQDLINYGLAGTHGAEYRRKSAGKMLGIGETNTKQFLNRLNQQGIVRRDLECVLEVLGED
ncbi:MAG: ribonuclease M5 [Peptococcaceae bacterium]|nr:ribonuclease M5 [Peptococcaceae bacterium]